MGEAGEGEGDDELLSAWWLICHGVRAEVLVMLLHSSIFDTFLVHPEPFTEAREEVAKLAMALSGGCSTC